VAELRCDHTYHARHCVHGTRRDSRKGKKMLYLFPIYLQIPLNYTKTHVVYLTQQTQPKRVEHGNSNPNLQAILSLYK